MCVGGQTYSRGVKSGEGAGGTRTCWLKGSRKQQPLRCGKVGTHQVCGHCGVGVWGRAGEGMHEWRERESCGCSATREDEIPAMHHEQNKRKRNVDVTSLLWWSSSMHQADAAKS